MYQARMVQPGGLETPVALKVLLSGLEAESQPVERLRDEGRLLARLEHPVILKAIDVVVLDGRVALVAEYVDGQDLAECASGRDRMPVRPLVQVLSDIASALHTALTAPGDDGTPLRMIHRDIKPSNIRIGRHGEVKLLDFGIARSDGMAREARTATQMVVGSLQYMAPERFTERPPGPEADVFALGACLYEGITGRRLYQHIAPPKALRLALDADHHASFVADRLSRLPDDLAPELRELLTLSLAHDPDLRPTATQLADQLDGLAGALEGPSLRAWARARTWPQAAGSDDGPLVGRVFTDTLAGPLVELDAAGSAWSAARPSQPAVSPEGATAPKTVPQPAGHTATRTLMGLAGLLLVVLIGAIAAISLVAGLAITAGETAAEALEMPPMEPAAQPVAMPEAAPAPVVAPAAAPSSDAAPTPAPTIAGPAPRGEADPPPRPDPVPQATGTITITGAQTAALVGPDGRVSASGPLPVGHYRVLVDFGGGETEVGTVELAADQALTVTCNGLLAKCTLP